MACKTVEVNVDGTRFEITQLGALEGGRVLSKLLKAASPALGDLADAEKLSIDTVLGALSRVVHELDEDLLAYLCGVFVQKTRCYIGPDTAPHMTPASFDQHFAGQYMGLSKWLFEHLKLNFPDFLGERLDSVRSALQAQSASPSPKA